MALYISFLRLLSSHSQYLFQILFLIMCMSVCEYGMSLLVPEEVRGIRSLSGWSFRILWIAWYGNRTRVLSKSSACLSSLCHPSAQLLTFTISETILRGLSSITIVTKSPDALVFISPGWRLVSLRNTDSLVLCVQVVCVSGGGVCVQVVVVVVGAFLFLCSLNDGLTSR